MVTSKTISTTSSLARDWQKYGIVIRFKEEADIKEKFGDTHENDRQVDRGITLRVTQGVRDKPKRFTPRRSQRILKLVWKKAGYY